MTETSTPGIDRILGKMSEPPRRAAAPATGPAPASDPGQGTPPPAKPRKATKKAAAGTKTTSRRTTRTSGKATGSATGPVGEGTPSRQPSSTRAAAVPATTGDRAAHPDDGERADVINVRIPRSTKDRLLLACARSRRRQVAIVNEALLAWLDENGY